ncbi:hypothetical protein, partial [Paenibacillus sp. IHBB 10380]|uniref:hypothetical protein n=1 Tax=Paenibacillus sp. IHBB 10380 TaxID=1566358 RepID=UPI0005CFE71C
MLEDLERKVLRILCNFSSMHQTMPTMRELEIKTGKRAERIKHVLMELEKKMYISWEDKSRVDGIIIMEAWE